MAKKSAIITGGAKRIGQSLAIRLAEQGYDIGLHYNRSKKEAVETKSAIESLGRNCVLLKCDLFDKTETSHLITMAATKLKNIELLVNSASIFEKAAFGETSICDLERNFAIHLMTPFILTSDFARICKRGNIINIIDSRIAKTDTEYFAYLLSKKALYELTRLTAKSLAPQIRVNAIAPGSTLEPIDWHDKENNYMDIRAKQVPLQIPGNTDYLMQGIDYLITNKFVTGECLFIDGGAHIEY